MSGHSKWSTIKRSKGVADAKRGQAFTKISNVVTLAVKLGGSGDPGTNPRLRLALEQAKEVNMPKDNINRAIERGLGKGKEALEEVVYEGFGPGQVAFYVEGVTDNRLRTNQEIINMFNRSGGRLASVAYMFEKKGQIKIKGKGGSAEDEMLELIDLGADDVEPLDDEDTQRYLVYTEGSELNTMSTKITQANFTVESQDLIMKPKTLHQITDIEVARKVLDFTDKLEEHDDIQKVFANFDISDEIINSI